MIFTTQIQRKLADLVEQQPIAEALGWKDIILLSAEQLEVTVTRQTMLKSSIVSDAYAAHRQRHREWRALKKTTTGQRGRDERVDALKVEIERLKAIVAQQDRRFVRYLFNAQEQGVTIEQLERPVLGIDVERHSR